MNPFTRLKLLSALFAVLWTGGMWWWSGEAGMVNLILLSICGAAVGYFWYRAMRWQFQRMGTLPRDEPIQ